MKTETIEEQVKEVYERHSFRERLAELGYRLSDEDFNRAFVTFKICNGD